MNKKNLIALILVVLVVLVYNFTNTPDFPEEEKDAYISNSANKEQPVDLTPPPPEEKDYSFVVLSQTEYARIVHFVNTGLYQITITASPFDSNRQQAEQDFLKVTGFTREGSCSRNVSISTPLSINPSEAGKVYHLSFCNKL